MSTLIPDLVGFTNNRAFDLIPHASVTRSAIVLSIVNTLTSCGWTLISGPTSTTHGDEYELRSSQANWYDPDNIPPWYLGGRVYLKIYHPNGSTISFQVGEWYNGAVSNAMNAPSEAISITPSVYASNSGDFFVIGNPFGCFVGIDLPTAPNQTEFFCCALNVPKPVQQEQLVVSSIIADRLRIATTMTGSTLVYSLWRTKDGGATKWFGNPSSKAAFLTVKGGGAGNQPYRSTRRLWRRDRDVFQTDGKEWEPFPLPSQISLATTARTGTPVWRGFIQDTMIYSENATQGSYMNMIGKSWYCYASGTSVSDSRPGSLWINIGAEGVTLS
jgi:hypothetical protein